MMISAIGISPNGIKGFGKMVVYGRNRDPFPPAKITAWTLDIVDIRLISIDVLTQPSQCNLQPLFEGDTTFPAAYRPELAGIANQALHLTLAWAQASTFGNDFYFLLGNALDQINQLPNRDFRIASGVKYLPHRPIGLNDFQERLDRVADIIKITRGFHIA